MAKYYVEFEFNVGGSVEVEANTKAEAEKTVRKQINFNLGELENNDSLTDHEVTAVHARLIK